MTGFRSSSCRGYESVASKEVCKNKEAASGVGSWELADGAREADRFRRRNTTRQGKYQPGIHLSFNFQAHRKRNIINPEWIWDLHRFLIIHFNLSILSYISMHLMLVRLKFFRWWNMKGTVRCPHQWTKRQWGPNHGGLRYKASQRLGADGYSLLCDMKRFSSNKISV